MSTMIQCTAEACTCYLLLLLRAGKFWREGPTGIFVIRDRNKIFSKKCDLQFIILVNREHVYLRDALFHVYFLLHL